MFGEHKQQISQIDVGGFIEARQEKEKRWEEGAAQDKDRHSTMGPKGLRAAPESSTPDTKPPRTMVRSGRWVTPRTTKRLLEMGETSQA